LAAAELCVGQSGEAIVSREYYAYTRTRCY